MLDLWSAISFLVALAMLVIVCEAITEILVASVLLDVIGLRKWAASKAVPEDNNFSNVRWYHTAIYKLLTCGYCVSVWMALLLSWLLPGQYFGILPWDNVFIKAFLIHRLSNLWHVWYEVRRRGRVNTIDVDLKVPVLAISGSLTHVNGECDEHSRCKTTGGIRTPGEETGQQDI